MYKTNYRLIILFWGVALLYSMEYSHAQIAKEKGLSLYEIKERIKVLSTDVNSREKLEFEAAELSKSDNEEFVKYSVDIYRNILQKNSKADEISQSILKRFPKGKSARLEAYNKICANRNVNANEFEALYHGFLNNFPENISDNKYEAIYLDAISEVILRFFKEKNLNKAKSYIDLLKNRGNYVIGYLSIARDLLKQKDYSNSLDILADIYNLMQEIESLKAEYRESFVPLYLTAIRENNQTNLSIELLGKLLSNEENVKMKSRIVMELFNVYKLNGDEAAAFSCIRDFLIKNDTDTETLSFIEQMYKQLNEPKDDYQSFITSLINQKNDYYEKKIKSEMIKEKAPNFKLRDLDGKSISLADLKGKIVILDFWATWCGPCIKSFPGMQSAIDKYKEDEEIKFLFINCHENGVLFIDGIKKMLVSNNYAFHVVFDSPSEESDGKYLIDTYKVKAIPTKVVIDKEGFIRFNSSGSSADVHKLVKEIATKIELARNE